MIDSALLFLLKLRCKAGIRQVWRNIKSPKKLVIYLAIVLWFCMAFGPSILWGVQKKPSDPETVRLVVTGAMFLFVLMQFVFSAGDRAVNFKPSEIDFLFTAPISRRQLVLYKIIFSLVTALFPALIFTLVLRPHATMWMAAALGAVFGQMFLQLVAIAFALFRQSLALQMYYRTRRYLLIALVLLLFIALKSMMPQEWRIPTFDEFQTLMDSTVLQIVFFPFSVIARIITATNWVSVLYWLPLAVLMNVVMILVVLSMDKNFVELSWQVSHKLSSRIKRAQSSGAFISSALKGDIKSRVPMFPWLGGAGPLLWRQVLQLCRVSKSVFIIHLVAPVGAGGALAYFSSNQHAVFILIGVLAYCTFLFSFHMRYDFRVDLDHIPLFKMLPLPSYGIVLSELAIPIFLLSATQILALLSFGLVGQKQWPLLCAAMLFALPVNTMLLAVHNVAFLLFPMRIGPNTAGDMQNFGRGLAMFFFVTLLILVCAGLSFGLGWLVSWLFWDNVFFTILVSWVFLCGFTVSLIPCVILAYNRFDIADIPSKM
jgi:hypothetical protein